ncbi:6288_t:CDS:2, partial [Paraglomus brasilianum]
AHVWVENWGYYDSNDPSTENHSRAENFMLNFIDKRSTEELEKPYILQNMLTNEQSLSLEKLRSFGGQAFWAYAGFARLDDSPPQWLGVPPHEPAGWY